MKISKDIDSIYRDRVKGAKMPPPPDAWKNILSHLPEKEEKKRFFPLWMKFAGVAAVMALILLIFKDSSGPAATEDFSFTRVSAKKDFNIPEASTTFNELMRESAVLLQALILESEKIELHSNYRDAAVAVEENDKKSVLQNIAIGGEHKSAENQVFSKGSAASLEPGASKTENSGIARAEETLKEQMASQNELADASPALQKNAPDNLSTGEPERKLSVSTRIAPVYFNNLGNGNAVEKSFSQKEAAGEVTFSYGVSIAYEVSGKLNIRSGINQVDLAYNTRQVSFNDVAGIPAFAENLREETMLASSAGGTLTQKMGFFEVPLEVEYVVLDKKVSVGLIGGGSVLFLGKNQVSFDALGESTDLGENNTMNKLSFTTNLGLSLGYDLSQKLQLSIEPVMKLPLNTFRHSQDSAPYFFGIYSGFSYRF